MAKKKGKTDATEITTRFLQLMNEVIAEGKCESKAEFARAIGEYKQNIYLLENYKRAPTISQLAAACREFEYNPTWLLLGISEKKMGLKDRKLLNKLNKP